MSKRQASESRNSDESDLIGEKLALTSSHSRASPCSLSLSYSLSLTHTHTHTHNRQMRTIFRCGICSRFDVASGEQNNENKIMLSVACRMLVMIMVDPSYKCRAMLHCRAQLEWQCSSGGTALLCSADSWPRKLELEKRRAYAWPYGPGAQTRSRNYWNCLANDTMRKTVTKYGRSNVFTIGWDAVSENKSSNESKVHEFTIPTYCTSTIVQRFSTFFW